MKKAEQTQFKFFKSYLISKNLTTIEFIQPTPLSNQLFVNVMFLSKNLRLPGENLEVHLIHSFLFFQGR